MDVNYKINQVNVSDSDLRNFLLGLRSQTFKFNNNNKYEINGGEFNIYLTNNGNNTATIFNEYNEQIGTAYIGQVGGTKNKQTSKKQTKETKYVKTEKVHKDKKGTVRKVYAKSGGGFYVKKRSEKTGKMGFRKVNL